MLQDHHHLPVDYVECIDPSRNCVTFFIDKIHTNLIFGLDIDFQPNSAGFYSVELSIFCELVIVGGVPIFRLQRWHFKFICLCSSIFEQKFDIIYAASWEHFISNINEF